MTTKQIRNASFSLLVTAFLATHQAVRVSADDATGDGAGCAVVSLGSSATECENRTRDFCCNYVWFETNGPCANAACYGDRTTKAGACTEVSPGHFQSAAFDCGCEEF